MEFCGYRVRARDIPVPVAASPEFLISEDARRLVLSIQYIGAASAQLYFGRFTPGSPPPPFQREVDYLFLGGLNASQHLHFHYRNFGAFMQMELWGFGGVADTLRISEIFVDEPWQFNKYGYGPCRQSYVRITESQQIGGSPDHLLLLSGNVRRNLLWLLPSNQTGQFYSLDRVDFCFHQPRRSNDVFQMPFNRGDFYDLLTGELTVNGGPGYVDNTSYFCEAYWAEQ